MRSSSGETVRNNGRITKGSKDGGNYPPFALDVHAAEHYTSVGRTVIYEAVRKKKLRMHRLGGNAIPAHRPGSLDARRIG